MSESEVLPGFTDRDDHDKLHPLQAPEKPRPFLAEWMHSVTGGRDRGSVRVLDVGCGRGGTVAWLISEGWDAYGLDIDERYVRNGQEYFTLHNLGKRLRVIDGPSYSFPDEHFDIVLSDQVFEHVEDLDALAQEVARVTKPGGLGMHIFPARWRFREPHMMTPVVHWLPKGPVRRRAIAASLRVGMSAPHFKELPLSERVTIFSRFSEHETFYRAPRQIGRALQRAGLEADWRSPSTQRVAAGRGGRGFGPLNSLAAYALRNVREMFVQTRKV